MRIGLRFFYRKIHSTGLENIPARGAAILIANHPSSLMDAALLGILLKRPAYFFARGDVFINKPVQKILAWLHMMPVHNHEAGRHTLGSNNSSFLDGQRVLEQGGIVVFFPESNSHTERQLHSFRKGVFRLAFKTGSDNQFAFEIPIIPIGITYDHPVHSRTQVQVHATTPLRMTDYRASYLENEPATLLRISKDAYQKLFQLILHIEKTNRLKTAEDCLTIQRNNTPTDSSSWIIPSLNKLVKEQATCKKINAADETQFQTLHQWCETYFTTLNQLQLKDQFLSPEYSFPLYKKILCWICFPIYVVGMALNGLPIALARWIANHKVTRPDFYSWIFVACYSCLYLIWMLLLLLPAFSFGWPFGIALILSMQLTGLTAFVYTGWLTEYQQLNKRERLPAEDLTALNSTRKKITDSLPI